MIVKVAPVVDRGVRSSHRRRVPLWFEIVVAGLAAAGGLAAIWVVVALITTS
jgi:hypothetical protein